MKVYAVTSCENDYNCTPDVESLRKKKHTLDQVAQVIHKKGLDQLGDEQILEVVNVWKGQDVRIGNHDWCLVEMETED